MPDLPEYTETCQCGAETRMLGVLPRDALTVLGSFREAHGICRTTPTVELTSEGDDPFPAILEAERRDHNPDDRCTCTQQDANVDYIYGNHHIRTCPLYIPHTTVQRTTS